MDDMLMESLAGFGSLWQRVTGQTAGPAEEHSGPEKTYAGQDMLPLLIQQEACAAEETAALARLCQADGRAMLLRQAAEARRHRRRLRAEYFILTGLTADSGSGCRPAAGKLASLRQAYLRANALAARYALAAQQPESPELGQVFSAFAADERRRAGELRTLLVDSF